MPAMTLLLIGFSEPRRSLSMGFDSELLNTRGKCIRLAFLRLLRRHDARRRPDAEREETIHGRRQHRHAHRAYLGRGSARAARLRPAGQAGDPHLQADHHRARPVAGLFARRGRALPAHPARSVARLRLHREGQHGGGRVQRHRGAGAGQSRRARGEAGDGGQDRAVQALRRHRRHRSGDRLRGCRRGGQRRALPRRLRRHQPGGHQGAGMLRHRAAAARADGHPGVPRRPARHRDRRRGGADQRLPPHRARTARHEAGGERRRRGRHRLRRAAEGDGHAAGACRAVRHQGRGLPGPHRRHEPVEVGARAQPRGRAR